MAKSDLLKQAIADANAVKETALANAKIALQEAFRPRLESMFADKLSEELDDEELPADDFNEPESVGVGLDFNNDGDYDLSGTLGADEEEDEFAADDDANMNPEDEYVDDAEEGDLELESILRELENDVNAVAGDEADLAEDFGYASHSGDFDDEEDFGYASHSGDFDDEEEFDPAHDIETAQHNKERRYESTGDMHGALDADGEPIEEDIDSIIEAILREEDLDAEGDVKSDAEEALAEAEEEIKEKDKELQEAYRTVKKLNSIINEVNLLNAKLLYTNKLFRNFELNESQKMKVIENFDRAGNTREVKLVFSTLAESFNRPRTKKKMVKESYASKPVRTTAPAKPILNEGFELANRWKKLAGLL